MAASFFQQSDTDRPTTTFSDLYHEDFVLAARRVGRRQLSRLDIAPYQRALLERGVNRWHRHQIPDRRMEQSMGYSGAVGVMLMDELARVCERSEERFTEVRMDLGRHWGQGVNYPVGTW